MTSAFFKLVVSVQYSAESAENPQLAACLLALNVLLWGSISLQHEQMMASRISLDSSYPVRKKGCSEGAFS